MVLAALNANAGTEEILGSSAPASKSNTLNVGSSLKRDAKTVPVVQKN